MVNDKIDISAYSEVDPVLLLEAALLTHAVIQAEADAALMELVFDDHLRDFCRQHNHLAERRPVESLEGLA